MADAKAKQKGVGCLRLSVHMQIGTCPTCTILTNLRLVPVIPCDPTNSIFSVEIRIGIGDAIQEHKIVRSYKINCNLGYLINIYVTS